MIFSGGSLEKPPVEIHDFYRRFSSATACRNVIFNGGSIGKLPVEIHDFYRQFC